MLFVLMARPGQVVLLNDAIDGAARAQADSASAIKSILDREEFGARGLWPWAPSSLFEPEFPRPLRRLLRGHQAWIKEVGLLASPDRPTIDRVLLIGHPRLAGLQ